MIFDPSNATARPNGSKKSALQEALQTITVFFTFALLWLGIIGLAYQLLHQGGWLDSILAGLWAKHPMAIVFAVIAVMAGTAWAKRATRPAQMFGKRGDVLFYAGLATGLYFAGKLIWTGSL